MPVLLAMFEVVFTFVNENNEHIHITKLIEYEKLYDKVDAAIQLGVYKVTATEMTEHLPALFKMWIRQGNGEYFHTAYVITTKDHDYEELSEAHSKLEE